MKAAFNEDLPNKANPSLSKVYDWIANDKDFASKILTARKIAAQTYLDKMIEELEFADNKNIAIVREKLHHYRWMASKLIGIYETNKKSNKIQIYKLLGAIPIKKKSKTLQTRLVQTAQTVSRTRHEVRK